MKWSIRMLSKSSPPRWVSPPVAITYISPPSVSMIETSTVPPPKSKTRMFFFLFLS